MIASVLFLCSLLFLVTVGTLYVLFTCVKELRTFGVAALDRMKANNLQEVVHVEHQRELQQVQLDQIKKAYEEANKAVEEPIQHKPRVVRDVEGREFNMDELEAL